MQERFKEPIHHAGVSKDRILFRIYLLWTILNLNLIKDKPVSTLGFVKTMAPSPSLERMVRTALPKLAIDPIQQQRIRDIENSLVRDIKKFSTPTLEQCRQLAAPYPWSDAILQFCHERLCLECVSS